MRRDDSIPEDRRTPQPPDPLRRRTPLPGSLPKSEAEDPQAALRVRRLMDSPVYREGSEDLDFLRSDVARGVRLDLDYLKPELQLQQYGVTEAIVVFGSTRLVEHKAAATRLDAAQRQAAAHPQDAARAQAMRRAERIAEKSRYYEVARQFGALVGAAPALAGGGKLAIVTGGGPGLMEAANRGAFEAGGNSVGLNINLPHEQFPNPYVTPDLCLRFHYFAIRKLHFLLRAAALVVFPGGFGSMDELFEVLTLAQTRKIEPLPIILVGKDFWSRAFDVEFLLEEGMIDPEDRDLFWYAESAEEIWEDILYWRQMAGRPLLGR
ncbi:TIGR00730 family Rossman fold protein [Methylocystis bryophila]|uniref:AMP nucleosidase n=1 Tax=Methylocystis bryophila TaxID=655015 RepID=A0A1W6MY92_9HYPH|nr:TIGR00730 family Rossman fold protein [Methylocystis bryophila]ARN82551.1 Rossman fold protein, TIGR00730 family [Methylocystis bryophila]BDV38758.1 hypothetical protein DSM21852_20110 [Methylocystis bryophila]